MRWHVLIGDLS